MCGGKSWPLFLLPVSPRKDQELQRGDGSPRTPLPLVPATTARCPSLGVPGNTGLPPSRMHKTRALLHSGVHRPRAGHSSYRKQQRRSRSRQTFKDQVSSGEKPSFVAFAAHFHGVNTANVMSLNSEMGRGAGQPPCHRFSLHRYSSCGNSGAEMLANVAKQLGSDVSRVYYLCV